MSSAPAVKDATKPFMDDQHAAQAYLQEYAAKLDAVGSVDDLWTKVLPWQHDEHFQHPKRGQHVQRFISRELQKMPHDDEAGRPENFKRQWLRYDHLPTTAVGGFNGLVVVAANPGYSQKSNDKEMGWRKDHDGNVEFCRDLFSKHAMHVSGIAWWMRVARFAFTAMTGEDAVERKQPYSRLLQWAQQGHVGAVDLIPFHSQSDELTGLVRSGRNDAGLAGSLYQVSRSTLAMVMRLRPKVVLVTSRSGAYMAELLAADLQMEDRGDLQVDFDHVVDVDGMKWPRSHSWTLKRHQLDPTEGTQTLLYTMPGQLFSTRAMLQEMQLPLAKLINKDLNSLTAA